jgi:pimeloyl-ACP methyl ester carboxylesterase
VSLVRAFFRALVLLASPAVVVLVAVVLTGPASPSGVGYMVALLSLTGAVVRSRARWARSLALAGGLLLLVTLVGRIAFGGAGRDLTMSVGAAEGAPAARWVDRVFDEEDLAVTGARALAWTGMLRDPDVPRLADVMSDAYRRMREDEGATPSPVVATYLGLETPAADDTLVVGDVASSAGVVVFLHGYAGSFTLPCWVIARAARDAGFATVCPATRWVGDWWSAAGEATLRTTVADLKRRGARRLVLAGLSNGGIGASLLAPRFGGVFSALILVSGASSQAPATRLPALILQGEHDAQVDAAGPRAYAARSGGRYVSLDAGHFAMLARESEVTTEVTAFLRRR